jgi:hypothetical protein
MAHAGGRPLKYANCVELQLWIDTYFSQTSEEDWTTSGLALFLDTTRETLMDYQHRDEFSDAIKRAKLKVQTAYEKDLRHKGRAGDIFALKNFGWKDTQDFNHGGQGNNPLGIIIKTTDGKTVDLTNGNNA